MFLSNLYFENINEMCPSNSSNSMWFAFITVPPEHVIYIDFYNMKIILV